MTAPDAQRIDKWLWHARFARTRAAAQKLAVSGHVRVNRDKVSAASRLVHPGDILTLALGDRVRVVRVVGLAERRGSYEHARTLYEEHAGRQADPTVGARHFKRMPTCG